MNFDAFYKRIRLYFMLMLVIALAQFGYSQNNTALESRYFSSMISRSDDTRLQQSMFFDTDDNFVVQGLPLINVISRVYETSPYLIVDGPDWIHTPMLYDIIAVPPPAFVKSDNGLLLENLLADRFKLVITRATRTINGLALSIEGDRTSFEVISEDNSPGIKFLPVPGKSSMRLEFSFSTLATQLSYELNQPVFDQTGMPGTFAIELEGIRTNRFERDFAPYLEQMDLQLESRDVITAVLEVTRIEHPKLDI